MRALAIPRGKVGPIAWGVRLDLQRLVVLAWVGLLDDQRVAHADPEQRAAGMVTLEGSETRADSPRQGASRG